jgi:hypothetical protein
MNIIKNVTPASSIGAALKLAFDRFHYVLIVRTVDNVL